MFGAAAKVVTCLKGRKDAHKIQQNSESTLSVAASCPPVAERTTAQLVLAVPPAATASANATTTMANELNLSSEVCILSCSLCSVHSVSLRLRLRRRERGRRRLFCIMLESFVNSLSTAADHFQVKRASRRCEQRSEIIIQTDGRTE